MRPAAAPVPIVPIGAISTSARIWHWRGTCNLTVVAKATFALQHQTVMSPIVPEPVHDEEIVPYREATDVLVVAAHAFSAQPTEATAVRLVLRGRQPHIDKSLLVYAPRPGGVPAPFQKAAIVKRRGHPQALVIDPNDPTQRGTFGVRDHLPKPPRKQRDGTFLIDDDIDWAGFHQAPKDQRVRYFVGDEWLILEGMTPDRTRFETRLPGAVVETRVYAPDLWCGQSLLVAMVPCSLRIDIDNHKCSLVWRGAFTVESAETARSLTLVSALHLPGGMTSWPTVDEVSRSRERIEHEAKLAALADTDRDSGMPPAGPDAEMKARVAARIQSLGPLATMPVGPGTEPIDLEAVATQQEGADTRMVVHRGGVLMLRPNDPMEMSITDTGTMDLPPDRAELAPPASTPIHLLDVAGAPWSRDQGGWQHNPSMRAAGGTVIDDHMETELPPSIEEQDVDTLERTLTDSLDEMQGDPIAELFDVGRRKK